MEQIQGLAKRLEGQYELVSMHVEHLSRLSLNFSLDKASQVCRKGREEKRKEENRWTKEAHLLFIEARRQEWELGRPIQSII